MRVATSFIRTINRTTNQVVVSITATGPLFLLAFWTLTFQYTLLGFFILLSACYMLMRGDFKKK
ncbi:hypothetical protein NQ314_001165 [Rhamnusium bicolor]|uniref:Uncharacterized protein n=1 Tax=Rhamnusium bicolor TaxID=1586634 RepID=A0AAV8ZT08_9CUCU|nr:hypothetical protein NQ314_001165 [Rhamnusium bicolor]